MIDLDLFNECFYLDQENWTLVWKDRPIHHFNCESSMKMANTKYSGKKAGYKNKRKKDKTAYIMIQISGRMISAHRVIYAMYHGLKSFNGMEIDHIDGNGLNNNISNLRLVSSLENNRNKSLLITNRSGVTGVRYDHKKNKWCASIWNNGKNRHLGVFDNIFDAVCARKSSQNAIGFHSNHGRVEID